MGMQGAWAGLGCLPEEISDPLRVNLPVLRKAHEEALAESFLNPKSASGRRKLSV